MAWSPDDSATRYVRPDMWIMPSFRHVMCCIGNMNGKYARSDSLGAAPGVKSVVFNCLVKIIAKHEQKQKFCYRRVLLS